VGVRASTRLELLYGARVMDVDGFRGAEPRSSPVSPIRTLRTARLEVGNFIDLGALAHLRNIPEAYFDSSLEALGDWEMLLRLTVDRSPLPLPVVALLYTTAAPNRISQSRTYAAAEIGSAIANAARSAASCPRLQLLISAGARDLHRRRDESAY